MTFKNYYLSIYRKKILYIIYKFIIFSLKGMGGVQDGSASKDTSYYSWRSVPDSGIPYRREVSHTSYPLTSMNVSGSQTQTCK